jgi:DNA invertase Pin-like site-specific DNA recombinase
MRVLAYLRVSQERADMISPDIQRSEIERFCAARGWTVTGWYQDIDLSGRTTERPGLQQLLRDATKAACDAVVFYRIDRLSREEADFHAILASLRRAGIHVDSVGNPNDGSAESALLWSISAALAKYESVRLGKRISDSHRELARKGRWGGGPVPFGWQRVRDADGPRLEVAEEEAHWRRWMHAQYWAGESTHAIARDLNRAGVRTRAGGPWTNGIVRAMLLAPVQIGARESDGELVQGGNIEPLLEQAAYERTVAMMPTQSRRTGKRSPLPVETRLFHCGTCGGPMRIIYSRGKAFYHCQSVGQGGPCTHGCAIEAGRAAEVAEAAVLARVHRMRPRKPRQAPAAATKAGDAGIVLSRAREAVARLSVMYAGGEMGEGEYRDAVRLARGRVEVAEAAVRAAEESAGVAVARTALVAVWAEVGRLSPEAWRALTVATRQQIVSLLVASITVLPGRLPAVERLQIEWRRL